MKEKTDKLDYQCHLIDLISNSLSKCPTGGVHRLQSEEPTSAMERVLHVLGGRGPWYEHSTFLNGLNTLATGIWW